ncbi:glutamine-hydrolyzing GMP synthase [Desulfotalea psychrophila]|uniref:GMP synthase [glutamine-hydrolyzing] n=1 Tax=Desulfotalea psychrophila (strain LSv54 / DSM 12343) TaxID=177439 RepID=GUAA_DESPS|nr:glutamine-hydrolyzing GMP synthase [Desulfotalea psychrophila]Q6APU2.1 RecName: Full=GMP synthase [glutamine-hydrolyzing]; AltName: Full=GMP synthetase; AltName: Full=Glutamine amidotransferase [Desulfotalea psychrophila LSv54]CAG35632.1 probable GMP synthase [glutamine-hydrolyzing] [Desulfotalea psychrophila LSv54]
MDIHKEKIIILDFGSQTTQLIARRVREMKVYSEIHPFSLPLEKLKELNPTGIILSGGPCSVYDDDAPHSDAGLFELGVPVFGICYGAQLMIQQLGGSVEKAEKREFGKAEIQILNDSDLFAGLDVARSHQVWMSHGDRVEVIPDQFEVSAESAHSPYAALRHRSKPFVAVQFHPEVVHSIIGTDLLRNFVFGLCKCQATWTMQGFIESNVAAIKEKVGDAHVICALSGGVDSSVVAAMIHKAIGSQLTCVYVNNGLMRIGESEGIIKFFKENTDLHLIDVDASDYFLGKLEGVTDPEVKRQHIGLGFIKIFEEEAHKIDGDVKFLAQGTLYPDVVESVSFRGAAPIKSHHNVGCLPDIMKLSLIEPLRELFKDEVRELGVELGLPDEAVHRQPFPGPGLSIRIMGEVTPERLDIVRRADVIVLDEMKKHGYYNKVWQSFAVLLPIQTVGVMGDFRTYEHVVALRVVDSRDAMTADWSRVPYDILGDISTRIINEVRGVNRVVYDISSKPPATIEWE